MLYVDVDGLPIALANVGGALYAFNERRTQTWPIPGWTLDWFEKAWHNPGVRDALWTSVKAGLGATAIAIVLGSLAAATIIWSSFLMYHGVWLAPHDEHRELELTAAEVRPPVQAQAAAVAAPARVADHGVIGFTAKAASKPSTRTSDSVAATSSRSGSAVSRHTSARSRRLT